MGDDCRYLRLARPFDHLVRMLRITTNADMRKNRAHYYDLGKDKTSNTVSGMIKDSQKVKAVVYKRWFTVARYNDGPVTPERRTDCMRSVA